jgi:hypothetical protein
MSTKNKVKVTSTIPQGQLGLALIDEMNKQYMVYFVKPGLSKELIEEDLMRGINENVGMHKMVSKGYFKIHGDEKIEEALSNSGVELDKRTLDDIELKLLLQKDMKTFVKEIETVQEMSLERLAHIMVDGKNLDIAKANELEKFISFKVSDLVAQKSLEDEK